MARGRKLHWSGASLAGWRATCRSQIYGYFVNRESGKEIPFPHVLFCLQTLSCANCIGYMALGVHHDECRHNEGGVQERIDVFRVFVFCSSYCS